MFLHPSEVHRKSHDLCQVLTEHVTVGQQGDDLVVRVADPDLEQRRAPSERRVDADAFNQAAGDVGIVFDHDRKPVRAGRGV